MSAVRVVDRYEIHTEVARGGMGSVHIARLRSDVGFSRTVAIKCINPLLAGEDAFAKMFADEARASSRILHTNVVSVLDVIETKGELFLVMDYCAGESLATLWQLAAANKQRIPLPIASAIVCGALQGLHAAHEAKSTNGEPLGLVHRDVSPQNILVGADGVTRVVDFGIAKAKQRLQPTTHLGDLKGKLGYLAPESVRSRPATPRTDIYAAGVVLWELVTGERMFEGTSRMQILEQIIVGLPTPPSAIVPDLPEALEAVIQTALDGEPECRFESARAMAVALAAATPPATASAVADWVESLAHDSLAERAALVAAVEALPPAPPTVDATLVMASPAPVVFPRSAATTARTSRRPSRLPLGLLLTFATLVLGVVLIVGLKRHAPARAPAPARPPEAIITTTVAQTPDPEPPEDPRPTEPITAPPPPPPPPTAQRRVGARADCNPPYRLDANGIRKYKLECH